MTVREIVTGYLKEHGYDGLCGESGGEPCGCVYTERDFMRCEGDVVKCTPAYEYIFVKDAETKCPDFEKCEEPGGCFYDTSFDSVLTGEDRQCACRRKKES
jgi:hypothetical protein